MACSHDFDFIFSYCLMVFASALVAGVTRYWMKSVNRDSRAILFRAKVINNTHYCRTMVSTY
jgi:hypothetical protein